MSPRSARGRLAAPTFRFTPQGPCGPIEPVLPVVLRSLLFLATLALPFVVALFAA
ncbi:hypothetical protein CI1B_76490 [Bradyrhizobium ivorense]|uniref:Uncharacterized protein n=1 Tax=Bradyrhizobium ivorense TaxID=2511166 RepID=A0A508TXH8_9BRAD|nr:hypothetical protein [Bradyrhizobium ivorense]MCC8942022.1 hypothetical protein [Bradyrhizobium ivorense]VIO79020.1 hypothetical protein CI1B_76490 [Bradyrhizobium ivorense]